MRAVLAAVAGALVSVALAAPAQAALGPPELYVRQQPWTTHEPVGGWIPLASAPKLDYLAGYMIGYKLQDSGEANNFQRVALQITAAPDGHPTQPYNTPPYCVGRAGTVGTIADAGAEVQFEGSGTYTVKVSVGPGTGPPGSDVATHCLTGPSTTASFSVVTRVTATLSGSPLSFRAKPLPGDPFVGLRAADPRGGLADIQCSLNGTVIPDDGDTHSVLGEDAFPRPGAWTCQARGTAEGVDDSFDTVIYGTAWSAPLPVAVRADFRRRTGRISGRRKKRPRFTLRAEYPGAAAGGRVKITLLRVKGCKASGYALKKGARFTGRFGTKNVTVRIRRPKVPAFYFGRVSFSGTHFLRKSTDPNPMLLIVKRRAMGFVPPAAFPRC